MSLYGSLFQPWYNPKWLTAQNTNQLTNRVLPSSFPNRIISLEFDEACPFLCGHCRQPVNAGSVCTSDWLNYSQCFNWPAFNFLSTPSAYCLRFSVGRVENLRWPRRTKATLTKTAKWKRTLTLIDKLCEELPITYPKTKLSDCLRECVAMGHEHSAYTETSQKYSWSVCDRFVVAVFLIFC